MLVVANCQRARSLVMLHHPYPNRSAAIRCAMTRSGAQELLALPRRGVASVACEQLVVRAAFDDRPAVEHDDLVHLLEAGEAVGDQQRRASALGGQQVADDRVGRLRVEVLARLVERSGSGSRRAARGRWPDAGAARRTCARRARPPRFADPSGSSSTQSSSRASASAVRSSIDGRVPPRQAQVLLERRVEHVDVLADEPDDAPVTHRRPDRRSRLRRASPSRPRRGGTATAPRRASTCRRRSHRRPPRACPGSGRDRLRRAPRAAAPGYELARPRTRRAGISALRDVASNEVWRESGSRERASPYCGSRASPSATGCAGSVTGGSASITSNTRAAARRTRWQRLGRRRQARHELERDQRDQRDPGQQHPVEAPVAHRGDADQQRAPHRKPRAQRGEALADAGGARARAGDRRSARRRSPAYGASAPPRPRWRSARGRLRVRSTTDAVSSPRAAACRASRARRKASGQPRHEHAGEDQRRRAGSRRPPAASTTRAPPWRRPRRARSRTPAPPSGAGPAASRRRARGAQAGLRCGRRAGRRAPVARAAHRP